MTLTGLAFGLFTAWLGYWYSERQHRREMAVRQTEIGVKMIEIALGVLSDEPDKNKPLREWAVKFWRFIRQKKRR